MLRIGLTGGIGSGKSTVSRLLAGHGAVIVDADEATGHAVSIERLDLSADDVETLVAQPAAAG